MASSRGERARCAAGDRTGEPLLRTMRAVRLHGFGERPRLETVAMPTPSAGQALVRVLATVLTHLDLTVAGGDFAIRPALPHTPGVEALGEVLGSREPEPGRSGQLVLLDGCVGLDRPGAFAEYVVAPAASLTPLARDADPLGELARHSPALTARDALFGAGAFQPGQRVAITGASGACGMLTSALAAHYREGGEAIACVRDPSSIARLPAGVTPLVDADGEAAPSAPVDLLVDFVGGPDLGRRLTWLRPGGRAVLVGYAAGSTISLSLPNALAAGITLVAFNGMVCPPAALPAGPPAMLPAVPYERIELEQIPDAWERLRRGRLGGRLIAMVAGALDSAPHA